MKRNVVSWRKEGNWVGCLGRVSLPSTMLISASFGDVTTMLRFREARWFQIVTINDNRWWLKEKVVGTFSARLCGLSLCVTILISFTPEWTHWRQPSSFLLYFFPVCFASFHFSKMRIWLQLCFHRFCLPLRYHPESSPWWTSRMLISWLRLVFQFISEAVQDFVCSSACTFIWNHLLFLLHLVLHDHIHLYIDFVFLHVI